MSGFIVKDSGGVICKVLYCENCGVAFWLKSGPNICFDKIRKEAGKKGWEVDYDGLLDFCPKCVKKIQGGNDEDV